MHVLGYLPRSTCNGRPHNAELCAPLMKWVFILNFSPCATQTDTRQSNFLYATKIPALLQGQFSRRLVATPCAIPYCIAIIPGLTLPDNTPTALYTKLVALFGSNLHCDCSKNSRAFYQYLGFVGENGTIDLSIRTLLIPLEALICWVYLILLKEL